MLKILSLVLYTALAFAANAEVPDLEPLKDGSMKKLVIADGGPVSDLGFEDAAGAQAGFADYRGKWLVVNFWATWCVPCREEMPGLDALQAEFGGDRFEVLPIAVGRNPPQAVDRFFEETGVTHLPKLYDRKQALARDMGVLGLPLTVLVDPEGNEVARLIGDADWSGDSAKAIVRALLAE